MPESLFHRELATRRRLLLPPGLGAEDRAKMAAALLAALQRQAELAERSAQVLAVRPAVIEEPDAFCIEHEPATTLFLTDAQALPRPEFTLLTWATWAALRALRAIEAAPAPLRRPHGSLCLEALAQDDLGRLKLGDFGIVAAYEAALGSDARRFLRCEPLAGHSGQWRLAGLRERFEHGWMATHRAIEHLDGNAPHTFASDQFTLAGALFLWASGRHPYYDDLSDPDFSACMITEPYALFDERAEWRGDGAPRGAAAWAALLEKMLAFAPTARFPTFTAALQALTPLTPAVWGEAADALTRAGRALRAGDAATFLEGAQGLTLDPDLPAVWRSRLEPVVERIERDRDRIAARAALSKRLRDAHEELDRGNHDAARALAEEVRDSPEADDALRDEAHALLDELITIATQLESAVDQLALGYIEQAKDAIEARRFDEAEAILAHCAGDTGLPVARRHQAERIRADLDELRRAIAAQLQKLQVATTAFKALDYEAARAALREMLADERLEPEIREPCGQLQERVYAALAREAEATEWLQTAATSWAAADVPALERALRAIGPAELRPGPEAERARWAAALRDLERAGTELPQVEAALAAEKPARAALLLEGLERLEWPALLREELARLRAECDLALHEQRQRMRAEQSAQLERVAALLKEGDTTTAREALTLLDDPEMTAELRATFESLQREHRRLEHGAAELAAIDALLSQRDADAAARRLDRLITQPWPPPLAIGCEARKTALQSLLVELRAAAELRAAEEARRAEQEEARRRAEAARQREEAERQVAELERQQAERELAIERELSALAELLEKEGRSARGFKPRIGALRAMPQMKPAQRAAAAALETRFRKLPGPRPPLALLAVGGGVLALAVIVAVVMLRPPAAPSVSSGVRNEQGDHAQEAAVVPMNMNGAPQLTQTSANNAVPFELENMNTATPVAQSNTNAAPSLTQSNENSPPPRDADAPAPLALAQRLAQSPPTPPIPIVVSDICRRSSPAYAALQDVAESARGRPDRPVSAAAPASDARAWTPAEDGESASQRWKVTVDGYALDLHATIRWDAERAGWDWTLALADVAALRAPASARSAELAHEIARRGAAGDLAGALALREETELALTAAQREPVLAGTAWATLPELPPAWTERAGYTAVAPRAGEPPERDARSGYPRMLVDALQRRLLLVVRAPTLDSTAAAAVDAARTKGPSAPPPTDAEYQVLCRAALDWQIFYIDEIRLAPRAARAEDDATVDSDSTTPDTPAEAARLAAARGRRLPTRAEWRAAALTHPAGLLGDGFVWCDDEGLPHAAGGARLALATGGPAQLFPPVPDLADRAALQEWLRHPLVVQRRELGDGLVGLRTILPIWPAR